MLGPAHNDALIYHPGEFRVLKRTQSASLVTDINIQGTYGDERVRLLNALPLLQLGLKERHMLSVDGCIIDGEIHGFLIGISFTLFVQDELGGSRDKVGAAGIGLLIIQDVLVVSPSDHQTLRVIESHVRRDFIDFSFDQGNLLRGVKYLHTLHTS